MDWPPPLSLMFMRHAFAAATCIAISGSAVGYFVVMRRQAFAAHALANVGFAGAAGATLLGVNPMIGLFVLIVSAALFLSTAGAQLAERDVSVGMILLFALALGVLFLNIYSANANTALGILFGSVLGITTEQVVLTAAVTLGVLTMLAILFRPLRFASVNEPAARARGVPTVVVGMLFMLTLAASAATAVPVIGALLSFAIFVGPAAAAQAWTGRVATGLLLTVVFALIQTWAGLLASYYFDYPATSWIAGFSFLFYMLGLGKRRWYPASEPDGRLTV